MRTLSERGTNDLVRGQSSSVGGPFKQTHQGDEVEDQMSSAKVHNTSQSFDKEDSSPCQGHQDRAKPEERNFDLNIIPEEDKPQKIPMQNPNMLLSLSSLGIPSQPIQHANDGTGDWALDLQLGFNMGNLCTGKVVMNQPQAWGEECRREGEHHHEAYVQRKE